MKHNLLNEKVWIDVMTAVILLT